MPHSYQTEMKNQEKQKRWQLKFWGKNIDFRHISECHKVHNVQFTELGRVEEEPVHQRDMEQSTGKILSQIGKQKKIIKGQGKILSSRCSPRFCIFLWWHRQLCIKLCYVFGGPSLVSRGKWLRMVIPLSQGNIHEFSTECYLLIKMDPYVYQRNWLKLNFLLSILQCENLSLHRLQDISEFSLCFDLFICVPWSQDAQQKLLCSL